MSRELAYPFRVEGGTVVSTSDREQILIAHVTSVLGTQPTERGMRPDYGCDLQRFAFSVGDPVIVEDMRALVDRTLRRWCPEVVLTRLEAQPPDSNGLFRVTVFFHDALDPRQGTVETALQFAVQGNGGDITERPV